MEQNKAISILTIDYRTACQQGWCFDGNYGETFMNREEALDHAKTLQSNDYETGVCKNITCGFVMWAVGTRALDINM